MVDPEEEPPWPQEIQAILRLLKLLLVVVPLGLLGAYGIGSCSLNRQSAAAREAAAHATFHSTAYEVGFDAGQACMRANQQPMSVGVLQNVAHMRYPSQEGDFIAGYRSGVVRAP